MADKPPNPHRRAFLNLLRAPVRLQRALLGIVYEALFPPTVSLEEHGEALKRIEELEAQIKALTEQGALDQETIQQLLLQGAEQDKNIAIVLDMLQKSLSRQDQEQVSRWQQLRQRLWNTLITLFGFTALSEALRDAWVQDVLWPIAQTLPGETQEMWYRLIQPDPHETQPVSPLQSPLPTPIPTIQQSYSRLWPYILSLENENEEIRSSIDDSRKEVSLLEDDIRKEVSRPRRDNVKALIDRWRWIERKYDRNDTRLDLLGARMKEIVICIKQIEQLRSNTADDALLAAIDAEITRTIARLKLLNISKVR